MLLAIALVGCGSDDSGDTKASPGTEFLGETRELGDQPLIATALAAADSGRTVLLGRTGRLTESEDCDGSEWAAAWVDDRGEIDRAVEIPYENCGRDVEQAERGPGGDITLLAGVYRPNTAAFESNAGSSFYLVRLRPSGELDPGFTGGIAYAQGMNPFALRSDGSVVTAGGEHYLNSGEIDPDFSNGRGRAFVLGGDIGGIAVAPDDSFEVVNLYYKTQEDLYVQRFSADGVPKDDPVDPANIVFPPRVDLEPRIESSLDTEIMGACRASDGGLVALVRYTEGQAMPKGRYALIKFLRGKDRLDPRFGREGRLLILPQLEQSQYLDVRDVIVQRDGRLAAVAQAGSKHEKTLVVRYLPDGRPDRSFGSEGVVELRIGRGVPLNLAEGKGGELIGANAQDSGLTTMFRLKHDGALDRQFGRAGLARIRP